MAKQRLYVITLEPLEKRYTRQWYDYWKKGFAEYFDVEYIDGYRDDVEHSDEIKEGRFLDINMTNAWKAEQVTKASLLFADKKINDGDIFLFADAWHFGITAIKYMAQLAKIDIKMFGYFHAGTYDPADFVAQAGLGEWASWNEIGWFNALDGSFVATKFHKELILKSYQGYIDDSKIHVVGFPMDWMAMIHKEIGTEVVPKENIIVFPHRKDKEKCPEVFERLAKEFPEYKFIFTLDVTKNKKEYYELLRKARIVFSASNQETYGIGAVEGLLLGCVPLVPNRLSYEEMYDGYFRYNNSLIAKSKLKYIMTHITSPAMKMKLKSNKEKLITDSLMALSSMAVIMREDKND